MGVGSSHVPLRAAVVVESHFHPVGKISLSLMRKRQSSWLSGEQKIVSFTSFFPSHTHTATYHTTMVSRAEVSTQTLERLRRESRSRLVWVTAHCHGRRHDIAVRLGDLLDTVVFRPFTDREATLNFTLTGDRDTKEPHFKTCFGRVNRGAEGSPVQQTLSQPRPEREQQRGEGGTAMQDFAQPSAGRAGPPVFTCPRSQQGAQELSDTHSAEGNTSPPQACEAPPVKVRHCVHSDLSEHRCHSPPQDRLEGHQDEMSSQEIHRKPSGTHTAPASLAQGRETSRGGRGRVGGCRQGTLLSIIGFFATVGFLAPWCLLAMYWVGFIEGNLPVD